MPALVPEANLKEKFDNEDYVKGVEDMFREKFLANLDVSLIVYPPVSKAGREVAHLTERKNPHTPVYCVKE